MNEREKGEMKMNICAICQRNRSTFSINIPIEGDEFDFEIKHVYGSCCDVIATIYGRSLLIEIEDRLHKLEVFTGMVAPEPLPETTPAGDAPTEARTTDEVEEIIPFAVLDPDVKHMQNDEYIFLL